MGNARRFAKNSLALTIAGLSVTFLGAVYRICIANYLGDVEFGKYVFITTYIGYFSALSLFGLRYVVTRDVARKPELYRSILWQSLKIRGTTTLLAISSAYGILLFMHKSPDVHIGVLVYGVSLFAVAAMDIIEGMIVARESSAYITISALVSNAIKIAVGIYLLRLGYGLITILWLYTVVSAFNTALSWLFFRIAYSKVEPSTTQDGAKVTRFLLREALPFFYVSLIGKIYYKNDVLILSILKGDRVVGWYGAAYLPVDALLTLGFSVTSAAYPIMSRLSGGDAGNLRHFHNSLSRYLMLMFIPVALLLTACGPELMGMVFNMDKFGAAAPTIRLLGWMPVSETVTLGMGSVLAATYNQRLTVRLTIINTIVNLGLCLALIPRFSYLGAAIGTVVSGFITLTIVTVAVNRAVHKINAWQIIGKPLLCAIIATVVLFCTVSKTGPWLGTVAALITFAVAVLLTGTLAREDYRVISAVLKRSSGSPDQP